MVYKYTKMTYTYYFKINISIAPLIQSNIGINKFTVTDYLDHLIWCDRHCSLSCRNIIEQVLNFHIQLFSSF